MRPITYRTLWFADFLLALIVTGPWLAPLFQASGLWPFPLIADWIIYPLGLLVCPEDWMRPAWEGHIIAVCVRCYAAIGTLLLVRLSLTQETALTRLVAQFPLPWQGAFILVTISLWQLDVWGMNQGWWTHTQLYEMIAGLPLGLAVGLLVYTILAHALGLRPAWQPSTTTSFSRGT